MSLVRIPLAGGLVLEFATEPGMRDPAPEFVRPRKPAPNVAPTLTDSEARRELPAATPGGAETRACGVPPNNLGRSEQSGRPFFQEGK